jgi:transketolase
MNNLQKRIIDISYKHKLSHLGSCLGSVDIIDKIYAVKKKNEPFILSNGHAALALYVVLEKYRYGKAEDLYLKHGTHPNRDLNDGIYVSTGSLGQGLTVAVGMALANRNRNVYCVISDGECAEGSIWEALRIAGEQRLENLRITVVANGYSAYEPVDVDLLDQRLQLFYPCLVIKTNLFDFPDWAQGLEAHYHVLSDQEYKEVYV